MNSWQRRSADEDLTERLTTLLEAGYLGPEHPSIVVHDLGKMETRLGELKDAFPPGSLHAVAVKANPLTAVLHRIVELGFGLEVASLAELELALWAGCKPRRCVFDSPAKTETEIAFALELDVVINANSISELRRIERAGARGRIGLRVNPMVSKAEAVTMVATPESKFGVPIMEAQAHLKDFPWVNGLHVHVGSQVATGEDLVKAAGRVLELARNHPQIEWLDIGGGLPTRYRAEDRGLSPEQYAQALREALPELFEYQLYTEIGRALQVGCGWAASRVEYVRRGQAILHLGADFAIREAYRPEEWWHEFSVFDSLGRPKQGSPQEVDLFGPLCFSGDRLARRRSLPPLEEGDIVVMHDVGGYTLGMWSRYCSRAMPEVIGLDGSDLKVLKRRERPKDLVRFWS